MIHYQPPGVYQPPVGVISSHDNLAVSWQLSTGGGSNTAMVANVAYYVPFVLATPATVYETWVVSGSLTTSNATEIGVYDTAFNRLFSTATTVASATIVVNSSGMTDYTLAPGSYYMAFSCDGTRNITTSALAIGIYQSFGCMEQTGLTGATLPNPMVPVVYTRAYLPLFGLNLRSVAL